MAVAHGQMKPKDLEKVMLEFLENKTQVLVCSAIIESGLDFPNANTIIINRADRFGLAQLYQLRGRVGRSHRHAYAYLLFPANRRLLRTPRRDCGRFKRSMGWVADSNWRCTIWKSAARVIFWGSSSPVILPPLDLSFTPK